MNKRSGHHPYYLGLEKDGVTTEALGYLLLERGAEFTFDVSRKLTYVNQFWAFFELSRWEGRCG